jgi:dCTP deaminase
MLSDVSIRKSIEKGRIKISPDPEDRQFQPASVDLRMGPDVLRVGPEEDVRLQLPGANLLLLPGQCALASTLEEVSIPTDMIARVEGKSTWGRQFLMVHSTAGFIDPGFVGQITLELRNIGPKMLSVPPGAFICQISFDWLSYPAERPYGHPALGSRYQGQTGPTPAVLYPAQ